MCLCLAQLLAWGACDHSHTSLASGLRSKVSTSPSRVGSQPGTSALHLPEAFLGLTVSRGLWQPTHTLGRLPQHRGHCLTLAVASQGLILCKHTLGTQGLHAPPGPWCWALLHL